MNERRTRLAGVSPRVASAVYLAAAQSLLPHYRDWLVRAGLLEPAVVAETVDAARVFVVTGEMPPGAVDLLGLLEAVVPDGDERGGVSSTAAQDCVICLDCSVRHVFGEIGRGDGAWFVFEPVVQRATERLFEVSDLGSEAEDSNVAAVLGAPAVRSAFTFFDDAMRRFGGLGELDGPSADEFQTLLTASGVLAPER